MPFLGEYQLDVKKGSVRLPWPPESLDSFSWYLSEASDRKNLILYVTNFGTPDPEFDHILDSGSLTLNKQGRWPLPPAFLEYLGERFVTICGVNDYFEVYADDYFDQQAEMMDALFSDLVF